VYAENEGIGTGENTIDVNQDEESGSDLDNGIQIGETGDSEGSKITVIISFDSSEYENQTVFIAQNSGIDLSGYRPVKSGYYLDHYELNGMVYNGEILAQNSTITAVWERPIYIWDEAEGTYTVTGQANGLFPSEETVTATYEQLKPSCDEEGSGLYKAVFSNPVFETQTKEVVLPISGHNYGFNGFIWSGNEETEYRAVAEYVCEHDVNHRLTIDAEIRKEEGEPTCETSDETIYTAIVSDAARADHTEHSETRTVTIPASGHSYAAPVYEWTEIEDGYSVTATAICEVDGHVLTEAVIPGYETIKEATYDTEGVRLYTAIFRDPLFEEQTMEGRIPVIAETPISDFDITVTGTTVMITDYKGDDTTVIIPSSVDGKKVVAIGPNVFLDNKELIEIVIPEGVKSIGYNAFSGCTNLSKVIMPASVAIIEEGAFSECSSLNSTGPIGSGNDYEFGWTAGIPAHAFEGCAELTEVIFPAALKTIGEHAFSRTKLTAVVIPKTVQSIGDYAFSDCALEKVSIPASVTNLGEFVFEYGLFESAGPLGSGSDFEFGWTTAIPAYAFANCYSLTNVSLPAGLKTIGALAFSDCQSLETVAIPEGVTTIGDRAFCTCSNLSQISLPASVATFGEGVFNGCNGLADDRGYVILGNILWWYKGDLEEVIIPDGVKRIGSGCFSYFNNVHSITIPETVTVIEKNAFNYCNQLTDIYYYGTRQKWNSIQVGAGNEKLEEANLHINAIPFETVLNSDGKTLTVSEYTGSSSVVAIPSSINGKKVTAIGDHIFSNNSSITDVWLPNGLTTIGDGAFFDCTSLEHITIPASITKVGGSAFWNCELLKTAGPMGSGANIEMDFGTQVKSIFAVMQENSYDTGTLFSNLEGITIPDGVTAINDFAFAHCEKLSWVEFR
ncbi:MAG: leucine-rich repeat protein, partial [Solobacterium sp.]|nr:leucine-rich repeat protein [Solobacterium sp.]